MLPLLSMLQIVNKFSEVETYFRKLSFWSNKFVKQILLTQKFKKVKKDFCCGNYRYLGGSKGTMAKNCRNADYVAKC